MHEVLQLSVLRGQRVKLVDVELAELFDVDRSTVLVGTVVELWVVLVDFFLFGVVESVAKGWKSGREKRYIGSVMRRRNVVSSNNLSFLRPPFFRLTQRYHPHRTLFSTSRWLPTSFWRGAGQTFVRARTEEGSCRRSDRSQ